jgi:twitching motility protein PilU
MQTFDKALFDLYQANVISYEDALRFADSHNDLHLKIKLAPGGRQPKDSGEKSDLHVM